MKMVALHDRPREKLQRLGSSALGDNELVAAVLGTGRAESDALALANAILANAGGIEGLTRSRGEDLMRVAGVGAARAAQVLAAVELGRRTLARAERYREPLTKPREVAELLLPLYGSRSVEHFGVVLLDTKHRVLRTTIVTIGTLDASIVHPREIFREAAAAGAAAIVVFHNHPSGDPEPSPEDMVLTRRLISAGLVMGIEVIDHVILGNVSYVSMKEQGYI
jgi:DNA repair protein RadC